jgi:hypothetical protein
VGAISALWCLRWRSQDDSTLSADSKQIQPLARKSPKWCCQPRRSVLGRGVLPPLA